MVKRGIITAYHANNSSAISTTMVMFLHNDPVHSYEVYVYGNGHLFRGNNGKLLYISNGSV